MYIGMGAYLEIQPFVDMISEQTTTETPLTEKISELSLGSR